MFKELEINKVVESKSNPRSYFSEEALKELAQSITLQGILQPILVRPIGKDCFEVVSGARRYRSAILAGLKTIPVSIKELTDDEVLEVQITENLQRENVNPMDEAITFAKIIALRHSTYEEIASRIGKSINFIKARLKLNDLVDDGKVHVYSGILPVLHASKIAMLSEKKQKEALKYVLVLGQDKLPIASRSLAELNWWFEQSTIKDLSKAPFKITDAKLYPEAGACTNCAKTSTENDSLFPEYKGVGCLDGLCYAVKIKQHVSNQKEALEKKHKTDIILISDVRWNAPEGLLGQHQYTEQSVEAKCSNCKIAMIAHSTSGKEGDAVWVCVQEQCPDKKEKGEVVDVVKQKKENIRKHAHRIAIDMAEMSITTELFDKKVLRTMFYLNLFIHFDDDIIQKIIDELSWDFLGGNDQPMMLGEVTAAAIFVDNFIGNKKETECIENHSALEAIKSWVQDGVDDNNDPTQEELKEYFHINIMNIVEGIAKQNENVAKKLASFHDSPDKIKLKNISINEIKLVYQSTHSLRQLAKKLGISLDNSEDYKEVFNQIISA